ncbi:MAG: helix-turn-helix domain-containing protein [Vulcanibacillus sp.]
MLRLKELRESKKLNQKELGRELNVAQNTISNWEKGIREPDSEMLHRLAKFFKVKIDELLTGEVVDIGWAVKEEREFQGVTIKELANKLEVNETTISQFEVGDAPISFVLAEKIAHSFGMSYEAFLDKYNLYDAYVHPIFNGDVEKQVAYDKAVKENAMQDPAQIYDINTSRNNKDKTSEEIEDTKTAKEIVNPDIRAIARAGEKMTTEDAAELKKLAERLFPDAFKDK